MWTIHRNGTLSRTRIIHSSQTKSSTPLPRWRSYYKVNICFITLVSNSKHRNRINNKFKAIKPYRTLCMATIIIISWTSCHKSTSLWTQTMVLHHSSIMTFTHIWNLSTRCLYSRIFSCSLRGIVYVHLGLMEGLQAQLVQLQVAMDLESFLTMAISDYYVIKLFL